MRTSQAARYARWAAVAAMLLTMTVAGVYARRAWQAAQVKKKAPPAVPPTVQQRSAEFSFSKVEKDRTLFTVRASRATEFKEGSRNLLEDVWIIIYGRTGERLDNIHTSACEYTSNPERILCAGEVHMDLESAEDARQHPSQAPGENPLARVIHLRTSNVSFDRESGEARTDQPVVFRFPYGEGRCTGLSYSSLQGVVRLLRDVDLTLAPPAGAVMETVGDSFAQLTRDELLKKLADADIAFAEVNTMADLAVHPHLRRIEVGTPNGKVSYAAPAAIFVGEPRHYGAVPGIGDHSELPKTPRARAKSS